MRAPALSFLALSVVACGGGADRPPAPPPAVQAPRAEGETPPTNVVDRTRLPAPAPPVKWAPPPVETWKLSNGIGVWFLRYGETPLVSVELIVKRGASTDPKGKAGTTSLMADVLDEGAGGKGALELSEAWQRLATSYSAAAGTDSVTFTLSSLADNLEASLELLSEVVTTPRFDRREFSRRKDQTIAAHLAGEAAPQTGMMLALRRALFGDGYGATPPSGTRPSVGRITLADVRAQYEKVIAPDVAAFVVVGGVDADEVKTSLEKWFGSWKGSATARAAGVDTSPPKPAVYFVDYPDKTQSVVALARRAPGMSARDYFDAMVMNRVLGGMFGSRLNLNLREDKGYTYGARSRFNRWRDAGFFYLSADVKTETTRATVDEMFKELSGICGTRRLGSAEISEAVEGLLLGFPGRFERVSGVASQLADLPLYDRPGDWYTKWPERVRAVTMKSANEAATGVCDHSGFIVVIAGDGKHVRPTLAGLDLAVVEYDPQGNPKR